jgi:hypothetical protein
MRGKRGTALDLGGGDMPLKKGRIGQNPHGCMGENGAFIRARSSRAREHDINFIFESAA